MTKNDINDIMSLATGHFKVVSGKMSSRRDKPRHGRSRK